MRLYFSGRCSSGSGVLRLPFFGSSSRSGFVCDTGRDELVGTTHHIGASFRSNGIAGIGILQIPRHTEEPVVYKGLIHFRLTNNNGDARFSQSIRRSDSRESRIWGVRIAPDARIVSSPWILCRLRAEHRWLAAVDNSVR